MTYSTTQQIGDRADVARKAAGVTVAKLAETLGVSESTMKRRLAGTHAWEAVEIAQAALMLGVSVDHLLLGEEAKSA